ncbi:MAG: hypothetical protein DRP84_10120 [Spirochaetes bacterium]|nr:MAG: hypothetical protein DRP84_10120 [Spirochaetota bacterium]
MWIIERRKEEIMGTLDKEINKMFSGAYNIIEEMVRKELEGVNPNSEQVYKKHVKNRDKFRTPEFLEMINRKIA